MAEIYLMHPKHGVKIATMEMEAQYDESHGWVRFDPEDLVEDAAVESPAADLPELADEANMMVEAPRRRGRPRVTKDE